MNRRMWFPAGLAVVIVLLALLAVGGSRAAPTATITFQGRVIEGPRDVEPPNPDAQYIEGATVSLWCANNPYPDQGTIVMTTTTNSDGYYGLTVEETIACEYLHIIETDPLGRSSNGASSVDGTVRTGNWIEFSSASEPFSTQNLTGTDNACDTAQGWHDTGSEACTYPCTGPVNINRAVYLPLVVRGDR
jgi:hypothetical protein